MKRLYEETDVQAIADAIRSKTGKTDKMKIADMADEVKGIEGKDTTLEDGLIDGTLTAYVNDRITYVRNYAFATYLKLKKVSMKNAESINYSSFSYCDNLETLDFSSAKSFSGYCFGEDKNLIKFILRNSEAVASLSATNVFSNTPIASGTGYIYVPKSLIDSYKTATNWSVYADQFRALEDYTVDGTTTGELDESKI